MKLPVLFTFSLVNLVSFAQKVELPVARFITGDDVSYSYPSTDDSRWQEMKTNTAWDYQGMSNYDGFAWYRLHLVVLPSLKERSLWKDSLRIYIGKVDDACEVYLNAVLIGKSGSFPGDKEGYISTWNKALEIHIAANSSFLNWGGENILSVRVYDGGGMGGIYGGTPYVNMVDLIDGVEIKTDQPVRFLSASKAKRNIKIKNLLNLQINGKLHYDIIDPDNNDTVKHVISLALKPGSNQLFSFPFTMTGRKNMLYTFEESRSHKTSEFAEIIPYILTPRPSLMPRINGAGIVGLRPNSPLLFKIPATGKIPLVYRIENLPEGLKLDPYKGILTGSLQKEGEFTLNVTVSNAIGTANKKLKIKCGNLLSLTPPMGWNSWNCWGLSVSDEKLRASAKAMMDKGLIDHGWTYMNIDDGWEADARKENGEIVPNGKFPDMKKLGEWLHTNGLKFGIYSSPGPKTCGGYLGSYQHEEQDAAKYAGWDIDYLKYDWCSYGEIHDKNDSSLESYQRPYLLMRDALVKQKRDIVYSLCQYGMKSVWTWGEKVNGNCWRTTGDIEDSWESLSGIGFNQVNQFPFAKPGRWNDPDMMVVGKVGWGTNTHTTRLTPDEQYTHVSLWCLLNAPLLIGCDLDKLDDFTLNLLTNDEVIAVDQDLLGKQAQQVLKTDSSQVWMKDLEDGRHAIGIFNMNDREEVVRFYWNNLGLSDNHNVRDLWRQKDLGKFRSMFATKLAPHGVTLIRIDH